MADCKDIHEGYAQAADSVSYILHGDDLFFWDGDTIHDYSFYVRYRAVAATVVAIGRRQRIFESQWSQPTAAIHLLLYFKNSKAGSC
jgi:hypothetical protein